jgi:hypothetical protein
MHMNIIAAQRHKRIANRSTTTRFIVKHETEIVRFRKVMSFGEFLLHVLQQFCKTFGEASETTVCARDG